MGEETFREEVRKLLTVKTHEVQQKCYQLWREITMSNPDDFDGLRGIPDTEPEPEEKLSMKAGEYDPLNFCPKCGKPLEEEGHGEPNLRLTIWHEEDGLHDPKEVIEDVAEAFNENGFLLISSVTALGSEIATAIRLDGVTRWNLRPMEG
jgi:hypothetical protein